MKHLPIFAVLAALVSGLAIDRAQAAGLEQPLHITIIGNYQTNVPDHGGHPFQMQVQLTTASVIRSIVIEDSFTNLLTGFSNPAYVRTNFFKSGRLLRRTDVDTGAESIILRWKTNVVDITPYFQGVENNFSASNQVVSSQVNLTTGKTNSISTMGLHTLSMTSSNISFSITGFGTATGVNVGTVGTNTVNKIVEMVTGYGSGLFSLNVGTNFHSSSSVVNGPAHGKWITGTPVFQQTP